ncbi:MAG: hypothetical protein ACREJO_16750 [Phycisphaerales bacterium]
MLVRSVVAALAVSSCAAAASADVVLSASLNVDNQFTAFISSDPDVQGTQFLSGTNWPTTYSANFNFTSAGTYYLQIFGEDLGPPAMFIGSFALSTPDGTFSNGTQALLTGGLNWMSSPVGFGAPGAPPVVLGPNGSGAWGNIAALGAAEFVWVPVVAGAPTNVAYFWTTITIVPTPGAASIVALGGLVMSRRRRV